MSLKAEGTGKGNLDVKRFYIPGIVLISSCPKCGEENRQDLGKRYLSEPCVGESFDHYFYCDKCYTEWAERMSVEINIRPGA